MTFQHLYPSKDSPCGTGCRVIAMSCRRGTILSALVMLAASLGCAWAQDEGPDATYRVEYSGSMPARIVVQATLPSDGQMLTMTESWPGNVPEVAGGGWPALVKDLAVTDSEGQPVAVVANGPAGWTLARSVTGTLSVQYAIDYAPLAAGDWPASREAAFADAGHLVVVGRSIFLTTPGQRSSEVRFSLPRGWQVVAPWPVRDGAIPSATVPSPDDLTENLIAFVREAPDVLTAGGFNLNVVALGHWVPVKDEVRRVLGTALQELVALSGFAGHADYVVILLPQIERGGESFRASFALNLDAAPSRGNLGDWGHTIAHEVFHYWNGWRLVGADYASSQWFQEGFTEYAAGLALVSGGLVGPGEFCDKLASHVTRYRQLATPLDAPGTRKGPPLYSGGALVAFVWDTLIREATDGALGVPDLLRALIPDTATDVRVYEWIDIQEALDGVAPGAWAEFHRRFIHGTEPLPLAEAFARVGLNMAEDRDGTLRIEPDPAASESAQLRLNAVMGGSR